ncbi:unnamed protein product [Caenorhabditis angaria]|uniref:Activin types I and II receptor domain-containing protein n=1 Tax=Caenorhabditis angaria TaxID=860376 RepID=A0A9P1IMS2_9PELO|nr:unnamed protein product [Caenorhabditis angaria]
MWIFGFSISFSTLIMIFGFKNSVNGLRCYEGSRGIVNGEETTNFVENLCDDNMQFCFESYNSNLTEVTASCQTMGTDPKLIDVCNMDNKCRERTDIDVTVCCCTSDLCNLQEDLKPDSLQTSTEKPPEKSSKEHSEEDEENVFESLMTNETRVFLK